jgi:hypothetical protein
MPRPARSCSGNSWSGDRGNRLLLDDRGARRLCPPYGGVPFPRRGWCVTVRRRCVGRVSGPLDPIARTSPHGAGRVTRRASEYGRLRRAGKQINAGIRTRPARLTHPMSVPGRRRPRRRPAGVSCSASVGGEDAAAPSGHRARRPQRSLLRDASHSRQVRLRDALQDEVGHGQSLRCVC